MRWFQACAFPPVLAERVDRDRIRNRPASGEDGLRPGWRVRGGDDRLGVSGDRSSVHYLSSATSTFCSCETTSKASCSSCCYRIRRRKATLGPQQGLDRAALVHCAI